MQQQEERPPFGDRGYTSIPRNAFTGVPGLALAMRMCRTRDADGAVIGLAHHMKRVPSEFVSRACTVGRGPEVFVVRCVCGATSFVAAELVECRGDCGRWLFGDESGVFAIRLPTQEADDEAR